LSAGSSGVTQSLSRRAVHKQRDEVSYRRPVKAFDHFVCTTLDGLDAKRALELTGEYFYFLTDAIL
jgi:hypothetical protein